MRYMLTTNDGELIDWLVDKLPVALGGQQVAQRAAGGVVITDLDPLRELTADEDGSITVAGGEIILWVEGDPYPLHPVEA